MNAKKGKKGTAVASREEVRRHLSGGMPSGEAPRLEIVTTVVKDIVMVSATKLCVWAYHWFFAWLTVLVGSAPPTTWMLKAVEVALDVATVYAVLAFVITDGIQICFQGVARFIPQVKYLRDLWRS